jgi:hypothetical protein
VPFGEQEVLDELVSKPDVAHQAPKAVDVRHVAFEPDGLAQEELPSAGRRLGSPASHWTAWCNGLRRVNPDQAHAVGAAVLQLHVEGIVIHHANHDRRLVRHVVGLDDLWDEERAQGQTEDEGPHGSPSC